MTENIYNSDFYDDGNGNKIHNTAIVNNNVTLGRGNIIGAYCVIGSNGEVRGFSQDEFKGRVVIGNNNIISELVTIQSPKDADAVTLIGDRNRITAHSHIGHDVQVGNDTEITFSILGGYSVIGDRVKIKMDCTIRNRVKIGAGALIGQGANVVKDVPAEMCAYGNPAKVICKVSELKKKI
jgi:acyl-[acyl carrier protein]--UDP-N-acetylglucosamine O-acyltransferase